MKKYRRMSVRDQVKVAESIRDLTKGGFQFDTIESLIDALGGTVGFPLKRHHVMTIFSSMPDSQLVMKRKYKVGTDNLVGDVSARLQILEKDLRLVREELASAIRYIKKEAGNEKP